MEEKAKIKGKFTDGNLYWIRELKNCEISDVVTVICGKVLERYPLGSMPAARKTHLFKQCLHR